MLDGAVDVVADGERYTLGPATSSGAASARSTPSRPSGPRWLETWAPGPPDRHSYRTSNATGNILAERSGEAAPQNPAPGERAMTKRPRGKPRRGACRNRLPRQKTAATSVPGQAAARSLPYGYSRREETPIDFPNEAPARSAP